MPNTDNAFKGGVAVGTGVIRRQGTGFAIAQQPKCRCNYRRTVQEAIENRQDDR
jgi:hypothetical protein